MISIMQQNLKKENGDLKLEEAKNERNVFKLNLSKVKKGNLNQKVKSTIKNNLNAL